MSKIIIPGKNNCPSIWQLQNDFHPWNLKNTYNYLFKNHEYKRKATLCFYDNFLIIKDANGNLLIPSDEELYIYLKDKCYV